MTTHNTFEIALLDELARLRKLFAARDQPELCLTILCSGPTMRDDIRIRFTVDGDYNTRSVEGNSIDACVDEFFRRNEWRRTHDALLLPNLTQDNTDAT